MVTTIKFSEFASPGNLENGDITVGLVTGANAQFMNLWTFLPPGTTAERPVISSEIYYRLRLNTDLGIYEYYDPILGEWVQLNSLSPVYPITVTVAAATTPATTFNATYNNMAAGVGATVTSNVNGALVLDGFSLVLNDLVLLKDSPADGLGVSPGVNGIYVVTDIGSISTPFVLTRSASFDTPAEFAVGQVALVSNGTVNSGTKWILTNAPNAIGDAPNPENYITYVQLDPNLAGYVNLIGDQTVYGIKTFVDPLIAENMLATPVVAINSPASINTTNATGLVTTDGFGDFLITSAAGAGLGITSGSQLTLTSPPGQNISLQVGTGAYFQINSTIGINGFINDNTMSTATATNAPTAISVKNYLGGPAAPTNGQIPIGNGTNFTQTTLTAGVGVTITNGAGSISIAATGAGAGGLQSFQIFTTPGAGTYTRPAGITSILVEIIGGGGGGAGVDSSSTGVVSGGAGGAGAYARKYYASAASTYAYSVGVGGAKGAAGPNDGSTGDESSFDTIIAGPGTGGSTQAVNPVPAMGGISGLGGSASGGDINVPGGPGIAGFGFTTSVIGGSGGASQYGTQSFQTPQFGAGVGSGAPGTNYGCGGGGACGIASLGIAAGGDGSSGIIIVWEFM